MNRVGVALAGAGAFGLKHLQALGRIAQADVVAIVESDTGKATQLRAEYGASKVRGTLAEALAMPEVDAVILCTPTPVHGEQALSCLAAGKHVLVEIPLADNLAAAQAVVDAQRKTGLIAMCGHTRRFNPSHSWIHDRIVEETFTLQQLDVQTHFFRRTNTNALGQPRSWTDHLLWHHAAHTVDLFAYQTGSDIVVANAIQGPVHPGLGIAMDMSIQLKSSTGAICTVSLSFNNDGPLGSFFRYIGDSGTYIARYDELLDGNGNAIDLSGVGPPPDGVEVQDRDFIASILERREPRSSVASTLPCYRTLDALARQLSGPVHS